MNERRPLLLALLLVALAFELVVLAWGERPLDIARLLFSNTWGNRYGLGQILFRTTAIALSAVAARVALRAGLFHLGVEGSIALSALAVGGLGAALPRTLPAPIAVTILVVVGMLVGALTSSVVAGLKVRFSAHEVISGIMLNHVVSGLTAWGFAAGLAEKGSVHTRPLPIAWVAARFSWFPGSSANVAGLLAIASLLGWAFVARRTPFGRELLAVAASPSAARGAGVRVDRRLVQALLLSGAIAGLASVHDVLCRGNAEEDRTEGLGFTGLAAALLAGDSVVGIVVASAFFATLAQGGLAINARVPREASDLLVGLVVLLVAVAPRMSAAIDRRWAR
ncbi:MAG: ABC transporter permease [Myxococcales bacterium]|nr:ABC transporter permease [Myxococcales bacterium]